MQKKAVKEGQIKKKKHKIYRKQKARVADINPTTPINNNTNRNGLINSIRKQTGYFKKQQDPAVCSLHTTMCC